MTGFIKQTFCVMLAFLLCIGILVLLTYKPNSAVDRHILTPICQHLATCFHSSQVEAIQRTPHALHTAIVHFMHPCASKCHALFWHTAPEEIERLRAFALVVGRSVDVSMKEHFDWLREAEKGGLAPWGATLVVGVRFAVELCGMWIVGQQVAESIAMLGRWVRGFGAATWAVLGALTVAVWLAWCRSEF